MEIALTAFRECRAVSNVPPLLLLLLHEYRISAVYPLLHVLRMVDKGFSILVVEDNFDVICSPDCLIHTVLDVVDKRDEIIINRTPEEVANYPTAYAARHLKLVLA